MTPIRREVIVVGGGQSGLAIGRPFPGEADSHPSRDEVREISTFHQALSAERRPAEQVA